MWVCQCICGSVGMWVCVENLYLRSCMFCRHLLIQLTFLVLPLMPNRDEHQNGSAYRNAINYRVHFHVILPLKPGHPTNDTIQIQWYRTINHNCNERKKKKRKKRTKNRKKIFVLIEIERETEALGIKKCVFSFCFVLFEQMLRFKFLSIWRL